MGILLIKSGLFFLLAFGSNGNDIFINSLERDSWNRDNNGCDGSRMELVNQVFLKCEGLNEDSLLKQLGIPNSVSPDGKTLKYFISTNCDETNQILNKNLILVISIKNGVVSSRGVDAKGG